MYLCPYILITIVITNCGSCEHTALVSSSTDIIVLCLAIRSPYVIFYFGIPVLNSELQHMFTSVYEIQSFFRMNQNMLCCEHQRALEQMVVKSLLKNHNGKMNFNFKCVLESKCNKAQ